MIMDTIKMESRDIPVIGEYDAVIAGGGTAGAIAAISCGMEGLKTLVVEQFGSLGGTQTLALVTPIMHSGIKGNPSSSAISRQIQERMLKMGSAAIEGDNNDGWFDPTMLCFVLEEMVLESGCEVMFHTVMTDVIRHDSMIDAIIIHNKNGFSAVRAKRFIDCTGDADLAYLAGVPVESGNSEGINQAVSLRFEMSNVDLDRFSKFLEEKGQKRLLKYPILHTGLWESKELDEFIYEKHREGYLTRLDISHFQMFSVPGKPKNICFNCPELGHQKNVIEAGYMSMKQTEGKIAIMRIARFMKQWVPGFEEAYICDVASMLGIRESRRIRSEYFLTSDDVFNYRKFNDGIATSNYPLDVHGAKDGIQKAYIDIEPGQRYYEIPFRSLIPLGIDNLLVVGRCAGTDFYAQSTTRVQHTCRAMGESAGIACRLSIDGNKAFRDLDGSLVRKKMILRGAEL